MTNFTQSYWIIDTAPGTAYSSETNSYLAATDPTFLVWLSAGNFAQRIASEAELWAVLSQSAPGYLPAWLFDGTIFSRPSPTTYRASQLAAYAALVRFGKETGGTTVSGVEYPSDHATQAKLTSAVLLAQVNPTTTFQWKLADGTFTAALNAAAITAVASAVGAFVQSCFNTEATVSAQIASGAITTTAQIDAAFAAL